MELPKKNKMMMLFLSEKSQPLRRVVHFVDGTPMKDIKITNDIVVQITGVSRQTPENWRQGTTMDAETADAVFTKTLDYLAKAYNKEPKPLDVQAEKEYRSLRAVIASYANAYDLPDLKLYDAAQLLGMGVTECQEAIDASIYEQWPLLANAWYPSKKSLGNHDYAKEEADRYEGVYVVWVRRQGVGWLQCPLRVRYLYARKKGGARFLRCKMNFPYIPARENMAYGEYDGFLAIRENRLFWTFERRERAGNDFLSFITNGRPTAGSPMSFIGRYLTTGQDTLQTIENDDIYMDFMFSEKDPAHLRYRDMMWSKAKIVTDAAEAEQVERRWQEVARRVAEREAEMGPKGNGVSADG